MIELLTLAIVIPLAMNLISLITKLIIRLSDESSETNKGKPITAILDDDGTDIDPFNNFRIGDDGEIE